MINCHHSTGHTGTNVISANELVDAAHHNDNISDMMSSGFHGNAKFRNLNLTLVHRIFVHGADPKMTLRSNTFIKERIE